MKKNRMLLAGLLLLFTAAKPASPEVSLGTLLREMTDRDEIARWPYPAFACRQASSTDPATKTPDQPGWFGNGDCTNFIRQETTPHGTEYVMLDADGPGAVVRFWMTFSGAGSGEGILRIYLDGDSEPVVEGRVRSLIGGAGLVGAPLSMGVSTLTDSMHRGLNLYLPIPFAEGCKITYQSSMIDFSDKGGIQPGHEGVFYNINYRSYEPGTRVVSFSAEELRRNRTLLSEVRRKLSDRDRGLDELKLREIPLDGTLAPGDRKTFTIEGEKAVRQLSVRLDAAARQQALRSTVLEIRFDGERTVWCPVGDFYGIGYLPLYTNTWYAYAEPSGRMDAYWVMPFRHKCEITFHNLGTQPVRLCDGRVRYAPWKWDDRSMHFGASWHQYGAVSTGRDKHQNTDDTGGPSDLRFVALDGQGVYVGDGLTLFNTEYAWWGEGDEKVYVDGETFPSHLGTGSEDYYGYAWGRRERITDHPFIAQPEGAGADSAGFVQNTRLRVLDGIPFRTSLRFDMELWHHLRAVVDYAPTTYWYLRPGGRSLVEPNEKEAARKVSLHREDLVSQKMEITVEAEHMAVVSKSPEDLLNYHHHGIPYRDIWSNNAQLYWHCNRPGNRLMLSFESVLDGEFDLTLMCTASPGYGVVGIEVNGTAVVRELDLNAPKPHVVPISLGRHVISKGINTLAFEMVRYGEHIPAGTVGFDRLVFEP